MKELSREEAIRMHRKMWNWLADETEKQNVSVDKFDFFKAHGIPESKRPLNYCYCCEYVYQTTGEELDVNWKTAEELPEDCADICPIDWGAEKDCMTDGSIFWGVKRDCMTEGSAFLQWYDTEEPEARAKIARIIAELPEKNQTLNEQ